MRSLAHVLFPLTLVFLGTAEPVRAAPPADRQPATPARTDAVGDPLPDRAVARIGTLRFRHAGAVYCVAYSPDGKLLASAGADDAVRLWDPATGKEVRAIPQRRAGV